MHRNEVRDKKGIPLNHTHTYILTHSLTHSFTHSLTHTHFHSLTHSLTLALNSVLTVQLETNLLQLNRPSLAQNKVGKIIASATPHWPTDTPREYHGITRGWIVNEVVRRADPGGRTVGSILREDICPPLELQRDLRLGFVDSEEQVRVLTPDNDSDSVYLSLSLTHSLSLSFTHSLTHSLSISFSRIHIHTYAHTHTHVTAAWFDPAVSSAS